MALLVSDRGSLAADDREISGDCRQFRLNVRYKFTCLTNNSGAIRHIVNRIRTKLYGGISCIDQFETERNAYTDMNKTFLKNICVLHL